MTWNRCEKCNRRGRDRSARRKEQPPSVGLYLPQLPLAVPARTPPPLRMRGDQQRGLLRRIFPRRDEMSRPPRQNYALLLNPSLFLGNSLPTRVGGRKRRHTASSGCVRTMWPWVRSRREPRVDAQNSTQLLLMLLKNTIDDKLAP